MSASYPPREPGSSPAPQPSPAPPAAGADGSSTLDRAHRILLETARQLGGSLEPAAIFARLQRSVVGAMRCDGLIVSSYDRDTQVIRCEYAWVGGNVLDPALLPPLQFKPDSEGMQSQVIRTGKPMRFSDVAERVRDPKGTYYEVEPDGSVRDLHDSPPPKSRSAVMVPLVLEDQVIGVVQAMADAEAVYSATDLELLEGISLLLAVALENARLYRRAQDDLLVRERAERVLREAEERYRAFVANSTEGIYRLEFEPPLDTSLPVDEQVRQAYACGRIAECNDAFARMYGYAHGVDMIGFELDRLLPAADPGCVAHVRRVIESNYGVVDAESGEVDRDGERVWFSNNLQGVIENRRLLRIWGTQRDISDRRRTEAALLDADRRKDEFLATLGHELRNPLHPLRNAVEVMRRKTFDDPDVRWSQQVIQRQVHHLTRLIDDLLDVGRITQGKLELRRSALLLDDVLDGAIESMRPIMDALGQRLTMRRAGAPVVLEGDPVRLAQVFSNLLDNASKYSPANAHVAVHVEPSAGEVAVRIRDHGNGISAAHLERVFDLFYQGDPNEARADGGLGIGLTLVKRLVEMHGGGIHVTSDGPGTGCEFIVRLPVAAHTPEFAPVSPAHAPSGRSWRILVADDNRDAADSMAMLLGMGGNEVKVAYDGEDALKLAEEFRPEVLLLDIGMPRIDGHELAGRVRALPWGRTAIMVAATGWGQERDRRRSAEKGFDAHLVKPVDHDALIALLDRIPRHRHD